MNVNEDADCEAILEVVDSNGSSVQTVLERYRDTESPAVAGALIGMISQCRRAGTVDAGVAVCALISLTRTLKVWRLGHSISTGLLAAIYAGIYDFGLPSTADRVALLDFIIEAASREPAENGEPRFDLAIGVVELCSALAGREELAKLVRSNDTALWLESRIMGFQRTMRETKGTLYEAYEAEITYVLDQLSQLSREQG